MKKYEIKEKSFLVTYEIKTIGKDVEDYEDFIDSVDDYWNSIIAGYAMDYFPTNYFLGIKTEDLFLEIPDDEKLSTTLGVRVDFYSFLNDESLFNDAFFDYKNAQDSFFDKYNDPTEFEKEYKDVVDEFIYHKYDDIDYLDEMGEDFGVEIVGEKQFIVTEEEINDIIKNYDTPNYKMIKLNE